MSSQTGNSGSSSRQGSNPDDPIYNVYSATESAAPSAPDWLILGDNSRYVFLEWILGSPLPSPQEFEIQVRFAPAFRVNQHGQQLQIGTPRLLPHTTLLFPAAASDPPPCASRRTVYAIFVGFPFERDENQQMIQKLLRKDCFRRILMVLMDLPRHQASTDLLPPGEDIRQAEANYRRNHRNFIILRSDQDVLNLLHWHEPFYQGYQRQMGQDLDDLRAAIDSSFPVGYQWFQEDLEISLLSPNMLDSLCSYQKVQEWRGDVWDCYCEQALAVCFSQPDQGLYKAIEPVYELLSSNPLTRDTAEDDCAKLRAALPQTLKQYLAANKVRSPKPSYLTKSAYEKALATAGNPLYALDTQFQTTLKQFIKDSPLRDLLLATLNKRHAQVQSLLPGNGAGKAAQPVKR